MTSGNGSPGAPIGRRSQQDVERRRLRLLKRAVKRLGNRSLIDRRTGVGKALAEWRESLIADLGGSAVITTQQAALVDLAVRTKLLADSVDAYVLNMRSPVNRRARALYPVVKERQALVSQIQSLLRDLGLERREKPVPDLTSYLAAKGRERDGRS